MFLLLSEKSEQYLKCCYGHDKNESTLIDLTNYAVTIL